VRRLLPLLALACAGGEDPCERVCPPAASTYAACLAEEGRSWESSEWGSEADFLDACATWAWEVRRLARAERAHDALDAECADREALLGEEGASCAAWDQLAWDGLP
jgi:hypothetical protein